MRVAVHLTAPTTYEAATTALRRARICATSYPDLAAVHTGLATDPPPAAVVTELRAAGGRPVVATLGRVHTRFPAVPIVVYSVPAPGLASDLIEAAPWVTAAALHGMDDLVAVIRRVVSKAAVREVATTALARVDPRLGPTTRPIVEYCLAHAADTPGVTQVALALGVSRKTVAARLAAERLPPASTLVGWGRVLLAAQSLEDTRRSIECVAHALGFADGTGLHHLLARYIGRRAGEVRATGGLAGVLPLFAAALDAGANGNSMAKRPDWRRVMAPP